MSDNNTSKTIHGNFGKMSLNELIELLKKKRLYNRISDSYQGWLQGY